MCFRCVLTPGVCVHPPGACMILLNTSADWAWGANKRHRKGLGYPQGCSAPPHVPYNSTEQACIFLVCAHNTCSMGCTWALVMHFLGDCVSHVYILQVYVCCRYVFLRCVLHVHLASGLHVCPHLCASCAYACSGDVYAPGVCTVLNSNACVTVHACPRHGCSSPRVYFMVCCILVPVCTHMQS